MRDSRIEFVMLGDFYPSGDEYELVYTATGRLIPPAGIPLQVGCVVNNVETLYNVHLAEQGTPVTEKFLSVCGAVKEPKSFWAPVGTPFRELLAMAGGATVSDFGIFISGIMMGTLTFDLDDVVTKTTGGLIVLPRDHYLMTRKTRPQEEMNHIGKSACDQCSYCTEFCPRYLLGYEVHAAQGDAQSGLHADGRRHLESVVGAVLRLRTVHAVRVSRGSVSEGSVRRRQEGSARGGLEVRAAEAGGGAPDEGVSARAVDAVAATSARWRNTRARRHS